jgi:hypothetical protein
MLMLQHASQIFVEDSESMAFSLQNMRPFLLGQDVTAHERNGRKARYFLPLGIWDVCREVV